MVLTNRSLIVIFYYVNNKPKGNKYDYPFQKIFYIPTPK